MNNEIADMEINAPNLMCKCNLPNCVPTPKLVRKN